MDEKIFRIDMLPAARGDCLLIEYGPRSTPHRVLIDGGIPRTHREIRRRLGAEPAKLELLVVTHIDYDHIGGVLELMRDPPPGLEIGDVWFNGWHHLVSSIDPPDETNPTHDDEEDDVLLGAKQAERLSARLVRGGHPWNRAFGGRAVRVDDDSGPLPEHTLPGG